MNQALATAVRAQADALIDRSYELQEDIPSDLHRLAKDVAELARVLARVLEGKPVLRAFGAPGDWGYGTPMGQAVRAAMSSANLHGNQPPDANPHQRDANDLGQHATDACLPVVARDLQVVDDTSLKGVVDPLPDAKQHGAQADQQNDLVRDLKGNGQRQDEHGDRHPQHQLVPIVEHQRFQPLHRASLQLDDINDPRLAHLIAAARDGTGPAVDLVGMDAEPVHAPRGSPTRLQRVAAWLRERIVVLLFVLAVVVILGSAPVIDDGAEVIAQDKADAIEQAGRVAAAEPAP